MARERIDPDAFPGNEPELPSTARVCPLDGAAMHADGYCPIGDGYPITLRDCPDVCQVCRRHLAWSGACHSCLPTGEKPGHLYDYTPYDKGNSTSAHWRLVTRGPQPLIKPTPEHKAALATLLAQYESRAEGLRRDPRAAPAPLTRPSHHNGASGNGVGGTHAP